MIWLVQFLTRNCMKFFSFAVIIVNLNGCKKQMANKVNKNETATALFQLENSNRFRNCRLDGICELQMLCAQGDRLHKRRRTKFDGLRIRF